MFGKQICPINSFHPSRKKSLSCKILQDSGRILQDDASSCTNFFQNLARSYKINFFLQEPYKINFFLTRILQDALFLSRTLQDTLFLARSYKINFCWQESCKILQDKLFSSTRAIKIVQILTPESRNIMFRKFEFVEKCKSVRS